MFTPCYSQAFSQSSTTSEASKASKFPAGCPPRFEPPSRGSNFVITLLSECFLEPSILMAATDELEDDSWFRTLQGFTEADIRASFFWIGNLTLAEPVAHSSSPSYHQELCLYCTSSPISHYPRFVASFVLSFCLLSLALIVAITTLLRQRPTLLHCRYYPCCSILSILWIILTFHGNPKQNNLGSF